MISDLMREMITASEVRGKCQAQTSVSLCSGKPEYFYLPTLPLKAVKKKLGETRAQLQEPSVIKKKNNTLQVKNFSFSRADLAAASTRQTVRLNLGSAQGKLRRPQASLTGCGDCNVVR